MPAHPLSQRTANNKDTGADTGAYCKYTYVPRDCDLNTVSSRRLMLIMYYYARLKLKLAKIVSVSMPAAES